jgi:hypothetical protein
MFFQKINFPMPVWNINFDIPEPGLRVQEVHFKNVEDIVPDDFLEKLNVIDQAPDYVRLFVWPTNHSSIWHIDGAGATTRHCSMNWVLKGSGLVQFNSNVQDWKSRVSNNNLIDIVEAETIADGYLINTGIPHRVVTQDDGRTTLSLAWKSKDIPFTEMVAKLSSIGLL